MANPWWALSEVSGQWAYFQATAAQAQARAKMTITYGGERALYGPYPTEAAAKAAVASGKDKPQQTGNPNPGLPTGLPNPLSGVNAIGDFFSRLTSASTWIRVAKVVIGGALLIIGLAHMTGAGNAAFTAARKVPVPV